MNQPTRAIQLIKSANIVYAKKAATLLIFETKLRKAGDVAVLI